ncbi:hypothetical protein AMECASPLE_019754 [Ameca splendens]|uniref:Uncharacterized protein n=1 Tax=Ameca splendens TaxID=208324 RepID=A0ABV0XS22_9TELE
MDGTTTELHTDRAKDWLKLQILECTVLILLHSFQEGVVTAGIPVMSKILNSVTQQILLGPDQPINWAHRRDIKAWNVLVKELPVLLRSSVSHFWSTDSSGSIKIPSFQTTELMTSGYRMRPSQRTKNLRHSYLLGPTSGWQPPVSAFYAPPRRRTLSTLRRASPSVQPQLWIISNHSQGLTFQNISAALSRPRIPLLLADVFHYLVAFRPWLCFRYDC